MEVTELITEIFKRESLWNQAHPDHHNRFVLEKEWEEVAKLFNTSRDKVKSKWKYCRDTFRKELSKRSIPRSGSEGGTEIESRWPYFKSLLFLKDQFTARKTTSNLPTGSSCANQETKNQDNEEEIYEHQSSDSSVIISQNVDNYIEKNELESDDMLLLPQSPASSNSEEPRVIIPSRKRKGPTDILGKTLVHIEKEKLRILEQKHNKSVDEDRSFFESILPHVRKMDPVKKLQFRSKIQELVMFYTYNYTESYNITTLDPPVNMESLLN